MVEGEGQAVGSVGKSTLLQRWVREALSDDIVCYIPLVLALVLVFAHSLVRFVLVHVSDSGSEDTFLLRV